MVEPTPVARAAFLRAFEVVAATAEASVVSTGSAAGVAAGMDGDENMHMTKV